MSPASFDEMLQFADVNVRQLTGPGRPWRTTKRTTNPSVGTTTEIRNVRMSRFPLQSAMSSLGRTRGIYTRLTRSLPKRI